MKHFYLPFLFVLMASSPLEAQQLLPLPQQSERYNGHFLLHQPLVLQNKSGQDIHLLSLLQNIKKNTTGHEGSSPRRIIFTSDSLLPSTEAYTLRITEDTLLITARHTAGFQYAQTTLQQLAHGDTLNACLIKDFPSFAWRGAMIDVSRHFFPIAFLKRQIDILAGYKINRLHLHLTDAAGWRMEIKRYPRLTALAAWRPEALWKTWWNGNRKYVEEGSRGAYGGYYTQRELRDLAEYAAQKNITIVPEIEMPAHSEEVLTAYPEFSCTHVPYCQADFCPGNESTYLFLENILREVMEVFPSPYIHIGGDEAAKTSWKDCPLCQQKMKDEQLEDTGALQTYFVRRIQNFLHRKGRIAVGWDEIVDNDLSRETHVMVWHDGDRTSHALALGFPVILSPGAHCYLDAYQDAPISQPEAIGGFLPLEKVYAFRPLEGIPAEQRQLIKGIQGNLWTEYVPTVTHAEYMLYPRMLAIAELGWRGTAPEDYADFRKRALAETDRLRQLGVNVFDLREERGERQEYFHPTHHRGIGARLQYNCPVSPYYAGQGPTTLTDGYFGGWNHGDGRWQGFIGEGGLDVTLDLGKLQDIYSVSTDFLQNCAADIYFPADFRVSISDDGQHFTQVFLRENVVSELPAIGAKEWIWEGKCTTRFIRIQAQRGHKRGWIFTDEIQIR